jgi:hypothetical protein
LIPFHICSNWWIYLWRSQCGLRSSPRPRPKSRALPLLHKRPPIKTNINSKTLCRRNNSVPDNYGSQTVLAYSTSGRARVKYACSFILIDGIFRFLRRKPRVLFALLVIQVMCWFHCNLFVNVRPKYLADVTDSSVCPWSWYLASIVYFLLEVLCIYQGGISCTIHFPAYLDLFVEFQHCCCWILSGTLLCHRRRVLLLMLASQLHPTNIKASCTQTNYNETSI